MSSNTVVCYYNWSKYYASSLHPQLTVYIRYRSWYCTLYAFGYVKKWREFSVIILISHFLTVKSVHISSFLPKSLETTQLFTVSQFFFFQNIIWLVSHQWRFSYRPLSLSNVYFSVLHPFSWFGSSYPLVLNNSPLSRSFTISLFTPLLLLSNGKYK